MRAAAVSTEVAAIKHVMPWLYRGLKRSSRNVVPGRRKAVPKM
jgi:hypothetical protein